MWLPSHVEIRAGNLIQYLSSATCFPWCSCYPHGFRVVPFAHVCHKSSRGTQISAGLFVCVAADCSIKYEHYKVLKAAACGLFFINLHCSFSFSSLRLFRFHSMHCFEWNEKVRANVCDSATWRCRRRSDGASDSQNWRHLDYVPHTLPTDGRTDRVGGWVGQRIRRPRGPLLAPQYATVFRVSREEVAKVCRLIYTQIIYSLCRRTRVR